MKRVVFLLLSTLLISVSALAIHKTENRNWLTEASEEERYERLEYYLGGFSSAMQETGERYAHVEQAIIDENYQLAAYHWQKIKDAIERGTMKRPDRRPNAERIFLGDPWQELLAALETEEPEDNKVRNRFKVAREACLACHIAEEVPFMNDQPLFTKSPIKDL
ncbi:hypothetical protein CWE09_02900 [Aliidiomarina minuta]|uniref:Cytochrome c domain-containing protein n=1 Tax=Aliidiomarina minuta TaxID=880057 RepID=A0A432W6J4_9GAMM|nr:hypothetical protein [Aliidiomarina minuta]RUO25695.1 hypothetical protein CWE09_02900 [Aliidiomarina minuta]